MDNSFENIVPWNGANDSGRDVRLKWERNFAKIGLNFQELAGKFNTADEMFDLIAEELNNRLRKDQPDSTEFLLKLFAGIEAGKFVTGESGAKIDANGDAEVRNLIARIKATVAALEAKTVTVSDKITTLDAVITGLAKAYNLTVENTADIMHGIIRQYLSSEVFVSGFLGEGFKIWQDGNGLWNGEFDKLTVRKTFYIFELVVQRIVHQGGMVIRSAAGGKLTKVTDGGTYWKCEHDSTDDFVVDDQVLCQTFTGTSLKRYWRLVTSSGAGYFNMSKADCEADSSTPESGDEVAVLGNRTNTDRQSAQIDCSVGVNAPYRDDYTGINSYSLSGKLINRTGNLTGIVDADFGALTGSGFYGKNVYLKGTFQLRSGKAVETAISDSQLELEAYADAIKTDLQGQIDGVVDNWYYAYTPTTNNMPASTWNTDVLKAQHVGDTFTNTQAYVDNTTTPDAGKSWRWVVNAGVYSWTQIADSDAVKALLATSKAQDTADGKRRVFTVTPFVPYSVGDLWAQGTAGDLMRCITARSTGSYTAGDWDKASKYTDDSSLNTFVSTTYTTQIQALETSISLRAAATTVSAIDTRLSSAEAKITSDAINFTVKAQTQQIAADASKRTQVTIDATGLDSSKYYPVTIFMDPTVPYTITVQRTLASSYGVPSYSTHPNGFSVICKWTSNGDGWGIVPVSRIVHSFAYAWSNVFVVGDIGQLSYSSQEYIYVRGGSKYDILVEGTSTATINLRTTTYTWQSGTYSQTLNILDSVTAPMVTYKNESEIKAGLEIVSGGIRFFGQDFSFAGKVTVGSLEASLQNTIANKANSSQVATDLTAQANAMAQKIGYADYNAMVAHSIAGQSIIDGASIRTSLINAEAIVTNGLAAKTIDAKNATISNLTVNNAKVIGSLRNPFTYVGDSFTSDYNDNVAVLTSGGGWVEPYALPWDISQSGRRITIVNYKWGSTVSQGVATTFAPSGSVFYEDGIAKSSLKISREAVELLGYGDKSTFYGWIVVRRIDIMTERKYGKPLKVLAQGIVNFNSPYVSFTKYVTFDGSILSISRLLEGRYKISFPSSWGLLINQYIVMLTGYGGVYTHPDSPCKASLYSMSTSSFIVDVSDDSTLNDGSFMFQIVNLNDWLI